MKSFSYIYLRWLLFAFLFLLTSPLLAVIYFPWMLLVGLFPNLDALKFLLAFPVLFWLIMVNLFAAEIAENVVFRSVPLGNSVKDAFDDMVSILSGLLGVIWDLLHRACLFVGRLFKKQ